MRARSVASWIDRQSLDPASSRVNELEGAVPDIPIRQFVADGGEVVVAGTIRGEYSRPRQLLSLPHETKNLGGSNAFEASRDASQAHPVASRIKRQSLGAVFRSVNEVPHGPTAERQCQSWHE